MRRYDIACRRTLPFQGNNTNKNQDMRNSGKIIFAVMLLVSMLPLTSCGKSEAPGLSSGGVGGNEGGTSEEYKYPKPSQSAIRLMTYNSPIIAAATRAHRPSRRRIRRTSPA